MNRCTISILTPEISMGYSFKARSIRGAKSRALNYLASCGFASCLLLPTDMPGVYIRCDCRSCRSVFVACFVKIYLEV